MRLARVSLVPSTVVTQTSVTGEDVMVTAAGGERILVRRRATRPPDRCPFLCHEVRRIEAAAQVLGSAG